MNEGGVKYNIIIDRYDSVKRCDNLRYLTAREQQLRKRRRRLTEQSNADQQLEEKEREIELLELELEKLHDDRKRSTGS